ncbi:hypothetical protein, partial [Ruminococcus bromii]|uniref:hypothetical protein n=1 Tax=Ruminococcus bromii TaxID=40518 RepID=UPI00266D24DE
PLELIDGHPTSPAALFLPPFYINSIKHTFLLYFSIKQKSFKPLTISFKHTTHNQPDFIGHLSKSRTFCYYDIFNHNPLCL